MLDITNKNVQNLGSMLNKTNDSERTAAYVGVAMAYSNTVIKTIMARGDFKITMEDKVNVNGLFYELNEIAVIDKGAFTSILLKAVKFKLDVTYGNDLMLSANDVTGINSAFGSDMVKVIDDNIEVVRSTYAEAVTVLDTI